MNDPLLNNSNISAQQSRKSGTPIVLEFWGEKEFPDNKKNFVMIFFSGFPSNLTSTFHLTSLQDFTWHLSNIPCNSRWSKTVMISLNVFHFFVSLTLFFFRFWNGNLSFCRIVGDVCCFSAKLYFVSKHEIALEGVFFENALYLLINWVVRRERGRTIVPTHDNLKSLKIVIGLYYRSAVFLIELLGSSADRIHFQSKLLLGGFHELCWLSRWEKQMLFLEK